MTTTAPVHVTDVVQLEEDRGTERRRVRPAVSWRFPVVAYLTVLGAIVLLAWLTVTLVTPFDGPRMVFPGDGVLVGLTRYDAGWYELIARDGYASHVAGKQSAVAFFPGYPLAMRYVGGLVGSNQWGGMIVTATCGLVMSTLFWSWCRGFMGRTAAATSLLALLLYPYSFFLYGALYAEALFLAATLLAFWALERDRPLLAGLAGAVATFTRPVGAAVVIGLVVRTLETRGCLTNPSPRWFGLPTRLRRGSLHARDLGVLVSVGGFAAYSGYLWRRFGDPLLFSTVERYWGQAPGRRTWLKLPFFEQLAEHPGSWFTWNLVAHAVVGLAMLAAVPLVARRFGWGYGAYTAVVLAIPLVGTKDFMAVGRYSLAAFPAFAIAGQILTERPPLARYAALASSAVLLGAASALFFHGLYVS
jgi:dolichyl-phosphate-mannose-protein mannosyltransferase